MSIKVCSTVGMISPNKSDGGHCRSNSCASFSVSLLSTCSVATVLAANSAPSSPKAQAHSTLPNIILDLSVDELALMFTKSKDNILILDVRSFLSFNRSHLRSSINISIPENISKRPNFAVKTIESVICATAKHRFRDRAGFDVVLYENERSQPSTTLLKIANSLQIEGKVRRIFWLQSGFEKFASVYPEYLQVDPIKPRSTTSSPRTTASKSTKESSDSSLVQVLDYLYIGDDQVAGNSETLLKSNILFILNTAKECPNYLQTDSRFTYQRMELNDNPDQPCIATVFEKACQFIDSARSNNSAVLVHCRAGRSRSATVVIAYLMSRLHWPLETAYQFLKAKRPSISPNLGFMGMLISYTAPSSSLSQSLTAPSSSLSQTLTAPSPSLSQSLTAPSLSCHSSSPSLQSLPSSSTSSSTLLTSGQTAANNTNTITTTPPTFSFAMSGLSSPNSVSKCISSSHELPTGQMGLGQHDSSSSPLSLASSPTCTPSSS